MISANQIKQLRDKTSLSMLECKNALEKAQGDQTKALEILGLRARELAAKKSKREAKQGLIESYIHNQGNIGTLLELNCETDFVARHSQFKELAHDLAMHIAAMDPENLETLLSQPFIKDQTKTIGDLLNEYIAKLGENIKIGEFKRLEV